MLRLSLTTRRRELLAETFAELANLAVAALVFGQALGSGRFSIGIALLGIIVWVVLGAIAYGFAGEHR